MGSGRDHELSNEGCNLETGHGTPVGTYLITVSDGKAVEIRVGETVITDRTYPINFGPYETIEDYFDIVDRLTSDKMSADVRFDPTYGYPKYISFRGRGVDNELNLEVLEFTNLS